MKSDDIARMYFDDLSRYVIGTKLKFVLFPKKCVITGRTLWLENAYMQTLMYTGPGEPVYNYRWFDKNEYLILKIKDMV